MKPYPSYKLDTDENISALLRYISKERINDVNDFNNLKNVFIYGRKVAKIPSSSSDVSSNRVGDFSFDVDYIYICVDNSGTVEWRRATLGSF